MYTKLADIMELAGWRSIAGSIAIRNLGSRA
jgi:hypothetical protein